MEKIVNCSLKSDLIFKMLSVNVNVIALILKKEKVDEKHLQFFNGCFYCVFKVGHFDSIGFTFFKFFDNFFV